MFHILICTLLSFFFQTHSEIIHTDLKTSEIKMIDTPTSRWIFDARHEALARMFIADYEKSEKILLPIFKQAPEKTYFLIHDQTDDANGSATVVPYPLVTLYPVFPSSKSPIGEFLDSSFELVLHEYTHILNLYPKHGLLSVVTFPLGNVGRPNMFLPRWMSEGLAVLTESELGGRLQSQFLEGYARAMTIENKWKNLGIDEINQAQPDWFGGARPYLWGSIWWKELADQFGKEKIFDINQSFSRRIPYLLDGPIEKYTGKDVEQIYQDALKKISNSTAQQIEVLSSQPALPGQKISTQDSIPDYVSFSPDGKHIAISSRDHHRKFLILRTLADGNRKKVFFNKKETVAFTQTEKISWKHDGSGFFIDGIDTVDRFFRFSDIYYCEITELKCKKITNGLRLHHPTLSIDSKTIYVIQNTPGSHVLSQVDLEGKNLNIIYTPPMHTRIIDIETINDSTLVFIQQSKSKKSEMLTFDLKSKTTRSLVSNIAVSSFLKKTDRGLIYSSSISGAENIYLIENSQLEKFLTNPEYKIEPRAITNTLTRAIQGDLDPRDGSLYYLSYATDGTELRWLSGPQWESLPDEPPKIDSIYSFKSSDTVSLTKTNNDLENSSASSQYSLQDYSVWNFMYPRYFIPMAFLIPQGMLFSMNTGASDPVGIHTYNLSMSWDTLTQKMSATGAYQNQSLGFPISISGGLLNTYYYPLKLTQQQYFGALQSQFYLPGLSNSWRGFAGWNFNHLEISLTNFERQGPTVGLSYSNLSQKGKEISPEEGIEFGLFHTEYFKALGNTGYGETSLHFEKYFSGWILPERHVIAFNTNASYAPNNPWSFLLGSSTVGVNFVNFRQNVHLLRGLLTGSFVGKNLISANLEYRFPIAYIFRGFSTWPAFFNRIHARLFWDTATLDGWRLTNDSGFVPGKIGTFTNSTGLEIHTDMILGYHAPFTSVVGLYYGTDASTTQGFTYFLGVQF